jgi:nucleoside 2-deoxyribosyltransferase
MMTTPPSPWIYLAAPLFTQAEIDFNAALAGQLRSQGYRVYLPQQECAGTTDAKELFRRCMVGLDGACLVLVVLDGTDADSGSCFEMGYAYARGLKIVGLRTDFRGSGEHMGLNLMLTNSCDRLILRTSQLPADQPETVTYLRLDDDPTTAVLQILSTLPVAEAAKT